MSREVTVERTWQAHGLDCCVLLMDRGYSRYGLERYHRCGYVRVPDDHPWHGVAYNAPVPGPAPDLAERSLDDAGMGGMLAMLGGDVDEWANRVEGRIAVHGGITFSNSLDHHGLDGWWFGFDCAHLDDTPDVWTLDATAAETERMAEQLAAVPA